jgi:regulator of nonsense transcripts 3
MASSAVPTRAQNGVLPVAAAQTSGNESRQAAARQSSQKLKLIVRRLAPALTEAEFLSVLGEEWKLGNGKVDWFRYHAGKDSKE